MLVYTAVFVLLCAAVFFPFLTAGKSFVGNGDGQSQYILQLRYMGEWLRQCVRDFLHGHFTLRTYDFTIGMGDDINAIVRFHPLDYLSVFVPAQFTEQLYAFLILLRLYLAGAAFSLYAFYWKQRGGEVLAGCITYLFCGYVFELGIVHPIYLAPMIVLPLLLLGAEYMMEKGGRHSFLLFTLMVYLGFTSNYYFMYINTVALPIYVLIRFFSRHSENRIRELLTLFICMVSAYLTGLLLSAVTLLPTLQRYFNSYRSENLSDAGNLLYYEDFRRYFAWLINLISPLEASGNGTHLNFQVVVLPAVVILIVCGRKRLRSLKKILFALLLFLLLPLGGYLMAVMHTENNRWVYLISLAMAMCVTFASGRFLNMSRLQKRALAAVTIVYDLAVAALSVLYPVSIYHLLAAAELTAFTSIVLWLEKRERMSDAVAVSSGKERSALEKEISDRRASSLQRRSILLVLTAAAVSTFLNGYFTFGGRFGNLTRYYAPRGTTQTFFSQSRYANYLNVPQAQDEETWDSGFYRVDGIWDRSGEDNASLQLGYPGVQIYNSVLNASQIAYLLDTQNIGLTTMLHIHSLDGRTAAEELAGVKYFQTQENKSTQVPFRFGTKVWTDGEMALWENDLPLAFGFTTDRIITKSDLDSLSAECRDEILLSAAAVEDEDAQSLSKDKGFVMTDGILETSGITSKELPLPEETDGIERTGEGYRVKEKNARLTLSYLRKAGCEVMIGFEGLKPDGFGAGMKVKASGISKRITLLSDSQTYTLGRQDYLVSLGYAQQDEEDTLRLSFTKTGSYAFRAIRIIYVPRGGYAESVENLNRYCLQNVRFGADTVTGTIDLEQNRYMVFQIPWSSGWSAKVNGEAAVLIRTDDCYMGLALEKGANEICLTYHTPGGRAGILLSVAGLVLLLAGMLLRRFQKGRAVPYSSQV